MNAPTTGNSMSQLSGRRRLSLLTDMQQGLTQPAPPRISIKAQRFTLVDAAGVQVPVNLFDAALGVYLDTVIIGVNPNKSKIYYEYDYDPTKDEAPTCFSDNGVAPSAQASVPQSPTCASCPNSAWGSDTSKMTGKPTKACSDRKKLAVIVANDPSQLVYQFQVPPASLKNLAVLAEQLQKHQTTDEEGPRPTGPADVVTRIYFNPKKQGELLFQPIGYHEQLYPYIDPLIEKAFDSGVIDLVTGKNDVPYAGAIALPNPTPQAMLPAPAQQMQAPPPPPMQPQQFQQPQFQQPAPQLSPMQSQQFQQMQPMQQAPNPQPASPAPRTRRGGPRTGAGRPAQNGAPAPAPQPTAAPFQPQAPQQAAQQPVHQQAPQGPAPGMPPAGQFQQPGPVPFHPQPAQPFTGGVPQQAGVPGQMPDMPAFLDRRAPAPQQGPAFGMTNGAQPDPALSQALESAFGAPMQPRARG